MQTTISEYSCLKFDEALFKIANHRNIFLRCLATFSYFLPSFFGLTLYNFSILEQVDGGARDDPDAYHISVSVSRERTNTRPTPPLNGSGPNPYTRRDETDTRGSVRIINKRQEEEDCICRMA